MLVIGHLKEDTVRVIALAFVVSAVGFSWTLGVGPAMADDAGGNPPTISQCYTVRLNPPFDVKPAVTVCEP
jgi:hypothetical protein